MKRVLLLLSFLALGVLFTAPMLHAAGLVSEAASRYGMILGTAGWFTTAPFWIRK
jgi:hypothetical protein